MKYINDRNNVFKSFPFRILQKMKKTIDRFDEFRMSFV